MKKDLYTPVAKVLGVIFIDVCTIVLVTSLILVMTLVDKSILNVKDLGKATFENSGYIDEISTKQIRTIVQYMKYCDEFETKGAFDEEKLVDVSAYTDTDVINGKAGKDGVGDTYALKDLVQWSKDGYSMTTPTLYSKLWIDESGKVYQTQSCQSTDGQIYSVDAEITNESQLGTNTKQQLLDLLAQNYDLYETDSGEMSLTDAYLYLKGAGSQESTGTDEAAISETDESAVAGAMSNDQTQQGAYHAEDAETGAVGEESSVVPFIMQACNMTEVESETTVDLIKEEYLPVEGYTILEQWALGRITEEQITLLSDNLSNTLDRLASNVTAYKQMRNRLDQMDSNVYYWFRESAESPVRTNISDESVRATQLDKYAENYGKYLIYNEKEMTLDTNVSEMEDYIYSTLDSAYEHDGNTMILMVGIDLTAPYSDVISEAKAEYNHLHPFVMVGIILAALSTIGWVICLLFLSCAAGHVKGREGFVTNAFDRIYGEILILVGLGVGVGLVTALFAFYDMDHAVSVNLAGAGALTLCGISVFLLIYMSFVRRAKAGIFWTQTIIYKIGAGLVKLYRTRKITTRIVLLFLLHLIICLILSIFAFADHRLTAWILLILFCIYEGAALVRDTIQRKKLADGIAQISEGFVEYKVDLAELTGTNKEMGEAINNVGEGLYKAVDASMKNERLKADLITNVSHDIKTPLTSIINYVDLIDREDIQNEKVKEYLKVLRSKSQRLKQLTEDLVEASKVSSGNVKMDIERIDFVELAYQTGAEFAEKFENNHLKEVDNFPATPIVILADGRSLYRVIENLYNNAAKYAQEHTRVYVDLSVKNDKAVFSIKNVSRQELNIKAEELTERFIRGDIARSTEGSGLGLSIAKNLTELMHGTFEIYLDGDLFKVNVTLPLAQEKPMEE